MGINYGVPKNVFIIRLILKKTGSQELDPVDQIFLRLKFDKYAQERIFCIRQTEKVGQSIC